MYTQADHELRLGWVQWWIADLGVKIAKKMFIGANTRCLDEKLITLVAWSDVMKRYNPDEEYNHISQDELDNLVEKVLSLCDSTECFPPHGLQFNT